MTDWRTDPELAARVQADAVEFTKALIGSFLADKRAGLKDSPATDRLLDSIGEDLRRDIPELSGLSIEASEELDRRIYRLTFVVAMAAAGAASVILDFEGAGGQIDTTVFNSVYGFDRDSPEGP